jgi:two-component system sensor histidine kinase KdpD
MLCWFGSKEGIWQGSAARYLFSPQEGGHTASQLSAVARGLLRLVGVLAAVVAAVLAVTALDFVLHVNSATAGFAFLVLILGLATRAKLREAIAASLLSVAAYNFFFLPPLRTFTIADPENWVALIAFLVTAVTASQLSASARQRAEEARVRQEELERMYRFSRALMLGEEDLPFPQQVLKQMFQCFDVREASFYDRATDQTTTTPEEGSSFKESTMEQVAAKGESWRTAAGTALVVPVKLGSASLGSLGIAGHSIPSEVAMQSIAQLVAIAIERTRAQEIWARMEASRESELLKATLLDALAHQFKTPLTSVKAATTTLLASPLDPLDQRELVTIVDEEADRLTRLVSDSIELARLGSAPVSLKKERCSAGEIISSVSDNMRALLDGRQLNVQASPDLPLVNVDKAMTELALQQILNNAFKYSPAGSEITIGARQKDDFVLITVTDLGPGIAKEDRHKIFDKFYRASEVRKRVPGTGIGLSITRDIIQSQGGKVLLESEPGHGARFTITLPVAPLSDSKGL